MICDYCHGISVYVPGSGGPCLHCYGMGTIHCCEGEQCQPAPDDADERHPDLRNTEDGK